MELRTGSLDFSAPVAGSGPRTSSTTVVFGREVADAVAALSGYSLGYDRSDADHHVGRLVADVATTVTDNAVTITATVGVRDWSGDWDDRYTGAVAWTLLADLVSASVPPPRGDVVVVGVEHNQAVQFWRSSRTLDAAHARPDNAIPLVTGKNTGLRVYADVDPDAGAPPISRLTGQVQLRTGSTTLALDPINPGGTITPRRDSEVNQSIADHTLNFMVPAAWAHGAVQLSYRLWDADDPTQRPSPTFVETLVFGQESALNYFVVGINYTASPATPPPTLTNFITTHLADVVRTYPMSDFPVNGYTTIDYGETVTGVMPSSGCGSGFDDLIDRMDDLQGDSDDIYVALLGAGIMGTPGNQLGGCGHPKSVAIFLDRGMDLPHETGHALGRQHAPCTMNRCSPSPANPDPNYPQYGSLRSDSIGGFGYDPTTNTVFDPAGTSDFMAYSGPNWVSAYTWSALAGAFAVPPGSARAHGITGVKVPVLHLGVSIARDRHVEVRPSFTYDDVQDGYGCGGCGGGGCAGGCGDQERFTVELLDEKERVVACDPLTHGCDCTPGCWPRHYRQKIAVPPGTATLRIHDRNGMLHEQSFSAPTKITIREPTKTPTGMRVQWRVSGAEPTEGRPMWYLVQWFDDEDEAWRGLRPRSTEASVVVPFRMLRRGPVKVRVLGTPGLGTGAAVVEVDGSGGVEGEPTVPTYDIVLAGPAQPSGAPMAHDSHVLFAVAVDDRGKTVPSADIAWVADDGTRLVQGATLDTRALPAGTHDVRAVVRAADSGASVSRTWRIVTGRGLPLVDYTTTAAPHGEGGTHIHPHGRQA